MKPKRKSGSAKKRAWVACSRYIRQKHADENGYAKCVTCGTVKHWKELDAGHFISKSRGNSIYFVEENIHPQCAGCNRFHEGNKHLYTLYMIDTYGKEKIEELEALAKTRVYYRLKDYEEIEEYFKKALEDLQS